MSDEDIERAEGRKASEAKHRAEAARLRQRWNEEGYRPMAHLDGVRMEGDTDVIQGFYNREHRALGYRRDIGSWLALYDMLDLSRTAHRQRMEARQAAEERANHAA